MILRKLTYFALLFVFGIFAAISCGKDPVFEQGDYIYENDDFTKVDNLNGIIIHWADDVEISEEQKTVIRNLVANLVRVEGGTFQMGAQNNDAQGDNYDPEAADNESPVHEVTLSRSPNRNGTLLWGMIWIGRSNMEWGRGGLLIMYPEPMLCYLLPS